MAGLKVPKDLTGEQYIAIEDSLLSSETGRAFLRARDRRAAVIAVGHVYTSEYEDRDGVRRSSLEMRATSVGPDVSKAIVQILSSVSSAGKDAEPVPTPEEHESASDEPAPPAEAAKADGLTPPAKAAEPALPAKADQLTPPTDPLVPGKSAKAKALPLSA